MLRRCGMLPIAEDQPAAPLAWPGRSRPSIPSAAADRPRTETVALFMASAATPADVRIRRDPAAVVRTDMGRSDDEILRVSSVEAERKASRHTVHPVDAVGLPRVLPEVAVGVLLLGLPRVLAMSVVVFPLIVPCLLLFGNPLMCLSRWVLLSVVLVWIGLCRLRRVLCDASHPTSRSSFPALASSATSPSVPSISSRMKQRIIRSTSGDAKTATSRADISGSSATRASRRLRDLGHVEHERGGDRRHRRGDSTVQLFLMLPT